MRHALLALTLLCLGSAAFALSLSDISGSEATDGLKGELSQATGAAVDKLGVTNGFLGDPKVKIPLPAPMQKAEKTMRKFGMGKQLDDLDTRMNRAAEAAVPAAKPVFVDAVKNMSVDDAKKILVGPDDAATQYFKKNTSAPLTDKFLPIVHNSTQKVQAAQAYNKVAKSGSKLGLSQKDLPDIDHYVTQKALDGLFLKMAEEEKAIRKNPAAAASAVVQKVFSSLLHL